MRRAITALTTSLFLLAALAGTASAARSEHFRDHFLGFSCDGASGGTVVETGGETSEHFGPFAILRIWLSPDDPSEVEATEFAETTDVSFAEGDGTFTFQATFAVTNENGDDLGTATVTGDMTAVGEPDLGFHDKIGNFQSRTRQVDQPYEGTGTLALDGGEIALDCQGNVVEFSSFVNSPDSEIFGNAGLQAVCEWQVGENDVVAFTIADEFNGFFASAQIEGPETEAFGTTEDGTFDLSSISWTAVMDDFAGGGQITGTFDASVELWGGPVTSWITHENSQERLVQQALSVAGTYTLSTGEVLTVDDDACDVEQFDFHRSKSFPTGGKTPAAPVNDTPNGAIALKLGKVVNAQTGGAALDGEIGIETCPEGELDNMGHTVWYTFTGTGGDVTIDPTGSGFDTLVAVYTRSGDTFTEVGCEDDFAGEPVGISLQGPLTVATEAGVTYYVQAGGFRQQDSEVAESGRLRLVIE